MNKCDRCHRPTRISTTSWFNTDTLCPTCEDEECRHPDYEYAKQVEREAVMRKDFNFVGVGWPGVDGRVQR